jgi:hypothetical protein
LNGHPITLNEGVHDPPGAVDLGGLDDVVRREHVRAEYLAPGPAGRTRYCRRVDHRLGASQRLDRAAKLGQVGNQEGAIRLSVARPDIDGAHVASRVQQLGDDVAAE